MDISRFFSVIFLIHFSISAAAMSLLPTEAPFWKTKEKVYRKIRDENAIIVNVKVHEDPSVKATPKLLRMEGGGMIAVPQNYAYEQSRNFQNLTKVSSHVRRADYNANDQTLFLHTEAFNYHAKMKLKLKFEDSSGAKKILFTVIEGHFLGMQGVVSFSEVNPRRTEIALATGYRYEKLPFPQFFVEFGLEVVIQKIAARLRSFLENEYQTQRLKK